MSARFFTLAIALTVAACGTLAPEGSGPQNLPVSGAGLYTKLASPSPLVADPVASLDDPQLFVSGEALDLWYTRRDGAGHAAIARARFVSLTDDSPVITIELSADRPWEGGSVSQPAVIPLAGDRMLVAYTTGAGSIGIAKFDGQAWSKPSEAALRPEGDEGTALSSPAFLALDDHRVRLVYLAAGSLRGADSTVEVLGALGTGALDRAAAPLLHAGDAPWLEEIGRVSARTVVTDRRRFDLFVTGRAAGLRVVGFAATFDPTATHFVVGATPFLEPKSPEEWAPSAAAWRGGSLLAFTGQSGRTTALFVASE